MKTQQYLIYLAIFCLISLPSASETVELKAKKVVPLEVSGSFEPSGLTFHQGKLLTVNDKDDQWIYQIVFEKDRAYLKKYLSLQVSKSIFSKLDFEGITSDGKFIYLVSELRSQVLKVDKLGKGEWLTSMQKSGETRGFFQVNNAGIEGITYLPNDKVLAAAERQPRGLIEYDLKKQKIVASQMWDYTEDQSVGKITPDFAALYYYEGKVWAVFRNARQIVELEKNKGKYSIQRRYSYKHITLSKEYRYKDTEFGLVEGLAVDDKHFYLVLDNNCDERVSNGSTNPLVLVLNR